MSEGEKSSSDTSGLDSGDSDTASSESETSEGTAKILPMPPQNLSRGRDQGQHFWISTLPFFDCALFILSHASATTPSETAISVYDPDGTLINSLEFSSPPGEVGMVELEQFLGCCKLESGMKHAHLLVRSDPGTRAVLRMHSHDSGCIMGPMTQVLMHRGTFFPISFAEDKSSFIALVNYSNEPSVLRCRLFQGTRTPEISISVPPRGARFFGLESEFSDCTAKGSDKAINGYVRLTTKSEGGLGVQLIERTDGLKGNSLFNSVS